MADPEKWAQVQDPDSEGRTMYQGMLVGLACFADRLLNFRGQISGMAERYFEPLERRNSGAYAEAYKENRTPAQKEYDRAYNRLKTRKQRGTISTGEWNAAVAAAQDLVDRLGIAAVRSVFNVLCTFLMLPLSGFLERLVTAVVPDAKQPETFAELGARLFAAPFLALERCHKVAADMAETAVNSLKEVLLSLAEYTVSPYPPSFWCVFTQDRGNVFAN